MLVIYLFINGGVLILNKKRNLAEAMVWSKWPDWPNRINISRHEQIPTLAVIGSWNYIKQTVCGCRMPDSLKHITNYTAVHIYNTYTYV